MKKLMPKQQRFVDEYLIDLNATQAAIRAGYSAKRASEIAYQLLHKTTVQEAVAVKRKAIEARTEITQDRVLREYAKIAFMDPRKLFTESGHPVAITDIDDDTAAAISGLDVLEQFEGSGDERQFVGYVKKYKLSDKKAALDSIARHLGMFNDKLDVSVTGGLADRLARARNRND